MSDEQHWDLVMPFIVTASHGGPYDDDAFVAGYQLGRLDRDLAVHAALEYSSISRTVYTATLPQVELIAMRHGYQVHTGRDHDGWTDVDFTASEVADD